MTLTRGTPCISTHTYTDAIHAIYTCVRSGLLKGEVKAPVYISYDTLPHIWYHTDTQSNHRTGPAHTPKLRQSRTTWPDRTSIRYVQLQLPPSSQTCIFWLHIYWTFFSTAHGQSHFDGIEAYGTFHWTSSIFWHYHGLRSFVFKGVIMIQWDSNTRWMQFMRKTSRVMGFHTINNNWNPRA